MAHGGQQYRSSPLHFRNRHVLLHLIAPHANRARQPECHVVAIDGRSPLKDQDATAPAMHTRTTRDESRLRGAD